MTDQPEPSRWPDRPDPPSTDTEALTRIVLRPIASSLPLGFFAFGLGSVLLTSVELGWVPLAQSRPVFVLMLLFVVPLMLIAGIMAFLARDGGAATALLTLGFAWAGTALVMASGKPGQPSPALAVFLLTLSPFVLVLSAAAFGGKPLFGALLLAGASRFVLVGAYNATGNTAVETAAGRLGVVLGAFALYGGLALLLEDTAQRTVLPLGRRSHARVSLEGGLRAQLTHAQHEAGVRRQL